MISLGRTSKDHHRCLITRRRHERLYLSFVYSSVWSNPARPWLPQHEVEVKTMLLSKSAELLNKNKVIRFLSNPKKTNTSLAIIVRHDWVDKTVNPCDSRLKSDDAYVPVLSDRTTFPLHFSIPMINILSLWALDFHFFSHLSQTKSTFKFNKCYVNDFLSFSSLRSLTKKSTVPASSILEMGM